MSSSLPLGVTQLSGDVVTMAERGEEVARPDRYAGASVGLSTEGPKSSL